MGAQCYQYWVRIHKARRERAFKPQRTQTPPPLSVGHLPDLSPAEHNGMFVKTDEVEGPLNESNNGTEMTLAATPCPLQRSKIRRIISHSYERMGCPPEWTRDGSFNQWKGKGGVIARLKSYLDVSWKAECFYGVLSTQPASISRSGL